MSSADDDLIGPAPKPAKKTRVRAVAADPALPESTLPGWQDFHRPVGVTFLMDVFKMERRTVQRRLLNCQPVGYDRGNNPLYDFTQAASHLVKPNWSHADLKNYLKSIRVQDLPSHLQDSYWSAKIKQQMWDLRAGNLWRTEDVLDVFGDVFQTIKNTMQLFPENLAENTDLSDDQRARLIEMVDALQGEIHAKLVELPSRRRTLSQAGIEDDDETPVTLDSTDEDMIG